MTERQTFVQMGERRSLPNIPGWIYYKFHYDASFVQNLKTKTPFVRPVASPRTEQKQCSGCGARKFELAGGQRICSYCRGEA